MADVSLELTLAALYAGHVGKTSDKWSGYLPVYERVFAPWRTQPVRLLEIGIQNGGSLEIWARYFANATRIVGCDINPDCAQLRYDDPRITVVVGDANLDATDEQITAAAPTFDLIIDDGSHRSGDIIGSFARYFGRLVEGGVYVAEDLHCSYWRAFDGGLFAPRGSIGFFKALADVVNHEHWGLPRARRELVAPLTQAYGWQVDDAILAQVHAVEFANSMCIVHKRAPAANVLGTRILAGTDDRVVPGNLGLHGSAPPVVDERGNPDSDFAVAPTALMARMRALEAMVANHDTRLETLRRRLQAVDAERLAALGQVQARDQEIARLTRNDAKLKRSFSWRATAPIRTLTKPLFRARTQLQAMAKGTAPGAVGSTTPVEQRDYAAWRARFDQLDDGLRARMRSAQAAWPSAPTISVVMPTYNSNPAWLREAVGSLQAQIYPHWQLCIADDASPDPQMRPLLESLAAADSRIKVTFRERNGHIAAASNSALALATGAWIALMDHDDVLTEDALFWVARTIVDHPDVQLIYSDEDKLDAQGVRCDPYFKADWNPDLFLSHNMFSHLGVYNAGLIRQIDGFRLGTEGSQDYDLVLRCLPHVQPSQIVHIPKVLYSWRVHPQSTAMTADAKPYAMVAGERVLNEHFTRTGVRGRIELLGSGYRAHYEVPSAAPLVSIIIPTRDRLDLLRQCIDSIEALTRYPAYEVVIVDNGSTEPDVLAYLRAGEAAGSFRVLRDDGDFNYSRLNNQAVAIARGELVCLLNNDIEVISPTWLDEMVGMAVQPGVGAVGAKLYYPDLTLQHGGVLLGVARIAGHAHKHVPRSNFGYFGRANLQQSFSAVTGACLLVQKTHYLAVGGLNEVELKVAYNDVDFCLRLREHGLRNVWTPYAELFHHEMASRGDDAAPERRPRLMREADYMLARWGNLLPYDPAYNPNLTVDAEDFSLAWPPRRPPAFTL